MEDKKQVVKIGKVINYAGAFIALLIGSGFATGQEIMQFFVSWGYYGVVAVVICFLLFAYVGISFVSAGYREKFEKPNDIYKYYCGNILGSFYDYFSVFFLFLSFVVMVGGAGAAAHQHYNWNKNMGGILIVVLTIVTVIFGLTRIVDVIGNIGPVIVVLAILVGTISIFMNLDGAKDAPVIVNQLVASGDVTMAESNHWILSAGSYVGFCMLWLAAFLGQLGKKANSNLEGKLGAFGGAFGFSLATLLMTLGIFFSISDLKGSKIPTLILAGKIHPFLANAFSIIIILGIFTTSVPLLWSVIARFAEEKTMKFKILTVVLGIIGGFIGLSFQFDILVKYVYGINGYVGLLLLFIMIFKSIKYKRI